MATSKERREAISGAVQRTLDQGVDAMRRGATITTGFSIDGVPRRLGNSEIIPESERPELPTAPREKCAADVKNVLEG